jgi:hypothetical protein
MGPEVVDLSGIARLRWERGDPAEGEAKISTAFAGRSVSAGIRASEGRNQEKNLKV